MEPFQGLTIFSTFPLDEVMPVRVLYTPPGGKDQDGNQQSALHGEPRAVAPMTHDLPSRPRSFSPVSQENGFSGDARALSLHVRKIWLSTST